MVFYYRGSCLEELDMRERSVATYEKVEATFPRSSAISLADLGIMRIAYRKDDRREVENRFKAITSSQASDSIKFHAYYLMGETSMRSGDLIKADGLFNMIPETHPEYIFAQHSKGVCAIINLDMENAALFFENCLQAQAKTPAQKEAYNRSCLLLGFLFYEQNSLSKAVTALRMVPSGSYYYEDALLGLGWCALKARQWDDCVNNGGLLAQVSGKPVLKYEGILVKSYGYIMQKNYDAANVELKAIYEPLLEYKPPSEDTLSTAGRKNENTRYEYEALASRAEEISLVEASSLTLQITDSMHTPQTVMQERLVKHDKFVDEFHRTGFFARGIDKIREDVEYAIAVVEKLAKVEGADKVKEKLKEKSEDIDDEIQKIEQEMKQIK
jgi:hypothetical protein